MVPTVRCAGVRVLVLFFALAASFSTVSQRAVADDGLTRVEISKLGKAATVLVEVKDRRAYGSAFCIHSSGLFLTNEHVAQGTVTVILNPGLKNEQICKAKVVRSDKDMDLALLRVEGVKDLPTVSLGTDEKLTELMEVVTVGFPFGTLLAPDRKGYPEVSINVGSITSLRRKDDVLHRIQLDAALNPGNSGGPVLDKSGKVVGVVVAGVQGSGVNFAIPVSVVQRFVARPDIYFDPPVLGPGNIHKAVVFEAQVVPLLESSAPLSVELVLKPSKGKERSQRMEAAEGKFRASMVPVTPPNEALSLRVLAHFENGTLNATLNDRKIKAAGKEVRLSDIARIQFKPNLQVVLHDGKTLEGPVTGFDEVQVQLGEQSLPIDLSKSLSLRFAPNVTTDQIWYTMIVRQGDKEVWRQTESLTLQGLLPVPVVAVSGENGIKPPPLQDEKTTRKLPSSIGNVAVGGGGRYLVLHLPKMHKLAVFDVNTAEIAGQIPIEEDSALFAANQEDVVILLPTAGAIERWSLKTLERDVSVPLPVKGILKSVAMGSASKGPLLVHSVAGTMAFDKASYTLIDTETLKALSNEVTLQPNQAALFRDFVHIRASANGKVFGLWCTNHVPNGVGSVIISDADSKAYYAHHAAGHVLPGPDGKTLFTCLGKSRPQVDFQERFEITSAMVPACHGDSYLVLPPANKPGAVTIQVPGKNEPVATLNNIDLTAPKEDAIKHDFTFDKRVHLIPDARLLIVIPNTDDRLLLYRLGN